MLLFASNTPVTPQLIQSKAKVHTKIDKLIACLLLTPTVYSSHATLISIFRISMGCSEPLELLLLLARMLFLKYLYSKLSHFSSVNYHVLPLFRCY